MSNKHIQYHGFVIQEIDNGKFTITDLSNMHRWMFPRDSVESAKAAIDSYLAKAI